MLLGARTAALSGGGGWVNPYQTSDNALIAMWDGEWNVAGGEPQNPNTNVWTDIIGGVVSDPIVDNVSASRWVKRKWLEKGLTFESNLDIVNYYSNCFCKINFSQNLIDAVNGNEVTLEVCASRVISLASTARVYTIIGWANNSAGGYWYSSPATTDVYLPVLFNANGTYSHVFTGTSLKAYRDGSLSSNSTITRRTIESGYSTYIHSGNYYCEPNSIVYCSRIYNRALSQSELEHNAETDHERFFT